MNSDTYDHPGSALALAVFRLNGALIAAGDELARPLGLTSARWQVMGAIAVEAGGLSAARIARAMGLARQSVQRLLDELAAEGIVAFAPNPEHKRAKLAQLTERGRALFDEISARWLDLADGWLAGVDAADVRAAAALLHRLRLPLEGDTP